MACDMYDGMIAFGGGYEGLIVAGQKADTDPDIDRDIFKAGQKKYKEKWMHLTHGKGGWGYYGNPVPWGVDPDIDYYLEINGHVRPKE